MDPVDPTVAATRRHVARASLLRGMNRHDASATEARQALSVDPQSVPALKELALSLCSLDRVDEAIDAARAAQALAPAHHHSYGVLGYVLAVAGRDREAGDAYREAIRLNPAQPFYYTGLANSLGERRDARERLAAVDQALALAPDNADVLHDVARALLIAGDRRPVEPYIRSAIALEPNSRDHWALLHYYLGLQRRWKDAVATWPDVVRLAPADVTLWFRHAVAFYCLKRFDEADAALEEVFRLDPEHSQAMNLRASVDRGRHSGCRGRAPAASTARFGPWDNCLHPVVEVEDPRALLRTYLCRKCNGVMMCACEQEWTMTYRPEGVEAVLRSRRRAREQVVIGFKPAVCRACRGLSEVPAPVTVGSPVERYYWREILMEVERRKGKDRPLEAMESLMEEALGSTIEREVVEEFEALHRRAPKYDLGPTGAPREPLTVWGMKRAD